MDRRIALWIGCIGLAAAVAAMAQENPNQNPPVQRGQPPTVQPPPVQPAAEPPADGKVPRLTLSMDAWDIGTKWFGEPCAAEVTLSNEGEAPLKLTRVQSSCGCTVAKPKNGQTWVGKVLQPGESEVLSLSYNTRKGAKKVSQKITIESNDPQRPRIEFEVKGEVKNVYEAKPNDRVIFGRLDPDSEDTQTVELTNNMDEPVHLKLRPVPENAPFRVELQENTAGRKYTLLVHTNPPLKIGANTINVELETGLERVPTMSIPVSAYLQPRVSVQPAQIFISPKVTKPLKKPVRVIYRPDKPIKITGWKCSDERIQVEVVPPGPQTPSAATGAAFHQLSVELPAGNEFPEDGATIEIYTDDPSPEYQKLVVDITTPEKFRQKQAKAGPQPGKEPPIIPAQTLGKQNPPQLKPAGQPEGEKPTDGGNPADSGQPAPAEKPASDQPEKP